MTSGLHPAPLLFLLLLLLLLLLLRGADSTCPSVCLCVSDAVSCSAGGLTKLPASLPPFAVTLDLGHNHLSWLGAGGFERLPRLENLRVTHNQISALGPGAFRNASGLRHLDLSSNRLRAVEQHYFAGLWRLEELLLYDNQIARVEAGALRGLGSLQRAYFSVNRITHFPFFAVRDHSHPFLAMLDLSSNRMSRLPWEEVKALPGAVQRGLYLHNNSLVCDCDMYAVFWHWDLRGYDALRDFADEHTCSVYGNPRAAIRFLRHSRFFSNCTVERAVSLPVTVLLKSVTVTEGDRVSLDCTTPLGGGPNLSFSWFSTSKGFTAPGGANDSLIRQLPDGTLEIRETKVNDSGSYTCTAVDVTQAVNATREVKVTVLRRPEEAFNTGYTTLLGCLVTTACILVYLYMTPCRCRCCKPPKTPAAPGAGAGYAPCGLNSVFSPSVRHQQKTDKHVAFEEPPGSDEETEWTPD